MENSWFFNNNLILTSWHLEIPYPSLCFCFYFFLTTFQFSTTADHIGELGLENTLKILK